MAGTPLSNDYFLGTRHGEDYELLLPQLYVGRAGTGSPMHWHGAALNALAHGAKRWLLLPPTRAVYSREPARELFAAHDANATRGRGDAAIDAALECEQRAGDILYVPSNWGHAVLNLEPSVGLAIEVVAM